MVLSKDFEFCIDLFAVCFGLFGYAIVTFNAWSNIYCSDLLTNGIATRILDSGTRISIQDQLDFSNHVLMIGIPMLCMTLWTWCSVNKLCIRYYFLFIPFTWVTSLFCMFILSFYWRQDRFKDVHVEEVDDLVLLNSMNMLNMIVCYTPVGISVLSLSRHIYNSTEDKDSVLWYRYPNGCCEICIAVIIDLMEFLFIPSIYIMILLSVFVICCASCDGGGSYETGTTGSSNDCLKNEKEIGGCFYLEKMVHETNITSTFEMV